LPVPPPLIPGFSSWMRQLHSQIAAIGRNEEQKIVYFYFGIKWDIGSSVIRDKLSQAEAGPGFSDLSSLIDSSGKPTPLFSAHQTIALKLGGFQEVETIKQQIRGKTILQGQYRFSKDDRVIYVLWGKGRLPSEIEGEVRVTDISGNEKIITSDSIRLTSSPIFIEIIE